MTINREAIREIAADYLYYHASADQVAASLSWTLGYRIDADDLKNHRWFDVEALIEGVLIARQLLDGRGEEKVDLSGLLQLEEARRAVIAVGEDWRDMTTVELLTWHPDHVEHDEWCPEPSEREEASAQTRAPFGAFASTVTRAIYGSPSS